MKMIRKKILFITLLVLCMIQVMSCGKNGSKKDLNIESKEEEKEDVSNSDSSETEDFKPTLKEAQEFSDGVAWIKVQDGAMCCIDTEGNKIFDLDCSDADPFINGYSIVENNFVVDKMGKTVYNWKDEGYSLWDRNALEKGVLILE